jgi:hypothetical protein
MLVRLLGVMMLAAVLLAGCSTSSSGTGSQSGVGRIGQPVRDGKFEFVVNKVDTTSTPGIVQVHLTVTNIGDESQMWSSSSQKLLVGDKEYDSDLFEGSEGIEDLNPGLGVDAVLGFKVPPGAVPDAIELHDSMFSQGVKVNL